MQGPNFAALTTMVFIFIALAGMFGTLWWRIDRKIAEVQAAGEGKIAELHLRIDEVKDTYARKEDMKDGLRGIEEDIRGLRDDIKRLGDQILSVLKKAERASPATNGARKRDFISGEPILPSRYILPSSGAIVLQASGPNSDRPLARRTIAVSRWLRCEPSARMCGVSTPALRAFSRISSSSCWVA